MQRKRRLSEVLLESERITAEDVARALSHQQTHGGRLGEALVELGVVRTEEIEWALATQLDLPFIFPDADSADPDATRLVPADWALAHLAVPILRAGRSLTVVAADPLDDEAVDNLRARTGLDVEMALATPARIRALIRAVYGVPEASMEAAGSETPLEGLVAEALALGADRIGVSARAARAMGWYTIGERRERRPLVDGWAAALDALVDPSPLGDGPGAARARATSATLRHAGVERAVDIVVTGGISGLEVLLRPRGSTAARVPPAELPVGIRADLRLLAAAGPVRVGVAGSGEAVDATLPRLPGLVLGDVARWAHVAPDGDLPGVFTIPAADDTDLPAVIEGYAFDALTADLPLEDPRLPGVLGAAPLSFARVPPDADAAALDRAGIAWLLTASGKGPDGPAWTLRPTDR